jgi:SnoaL-like domain
MEPRKMPANIVREYFSCYESKDKKALEGLLSDDFTFTSPLDDHIDKADYFAKCWPFSEKVQAFHIQRLFDQGSEAFVLYECEPKGDARFRNTEFFKLAGNKIKEVEVYFGSLPESKQPG